jgi:hypothetical protein
MSHAKRDVSDESAAEALRVEIRAIPIDVVDREIRYWAFREDYLGDRAYRLLVAVHGGGSVAPSEASDRIRFEQEAMLGRLPLPDAFERLADAEPELRRLKEVALAGKKVRARDLRGLLGPSARRSDPVLQEEIALLIAMFYLWDCAHGRAGSVKSYFERASIRTGTVRWTGTVG